MSETTPHDAIRQRVRDPINPAWENLQVSASRNDGHIDWKGFFDQRELQEIDFDKIYAEQFSHGTDGHNARLIIAQMAHMLDLVCSNIQLAPDEDPTKEPLTFSHEEWVLLGELKTACEGTSLSPKDLLSEMIVRLKNRGKDSE